MAARRARRVADRARIAAIKPCANGGRAHHWMVTSKNYGVCKRCKQEFQFNPYLDSWNEVITKSKDTQEAAK